MQLLSYAEMLASATNVCETLKDIPCIGDGDTGYGNCVSIKRTVKGYAQVRYLYQSLMRRRDSLKATEGIVRPHPRVSS